MKSKRLFISDYPALVPAYQHLFNPFRFQLLATFPKSLLVGNTCEEKPRFIRHMKSPKFFSKELKGHF